MRNYAALIMMAIFMLSMTSFAAPQPPGWSCPLKNARKSQLRGPDGTAYFPGQSAKKVIDAVKKVYARQ